MLNLSSDMRKLHLLGAHAIAQESLGTGILVSDFLRYCFSHFWTNLTTSFKSFGISELETFHQRRVSALDHLLTKPLVRFDDVIVPIPKGMVQAYQPTVTNLCDILTTLHADTLLTDLNNVLTALQTRSLSSVSLPNYSQDQYKRHQHRLSKLYGVVGLTHATADFALRSQASIGQVNQTLTDLVKTYYPIVMSLNTLLGKIESTHAKMTWGEGDKKRLAALLLPLANRLSLFALVMDHLQATEHQFVGALNVLLAKSI